MAKRPHFLFAHGAGAPSSSTWMRRYAEQLGKLGTVHCFDYPYFAEGRRAPDRLPKLVEAHRRALGAVRKKAHESKLILIGKSMGGRVGCHLALEEPVDGLVCLGYPLKGMGRGAIRDQVLRELRTPILFVQGTRDNLCPLDLLQSVRTQMTAPNSLFVVESGNHSLEATKTSLKKEGVTQAQIEASIIEHIDAFVSELPTHR